MALFVDLAGNCEKIVKHMSELTKSNNPMLLGRRTGMLDFLTNPLNGSVKLDLNNVQEGRKYVKTKLLYKQPTLACQILEDEDIQSVCDGGEEPLEKSVDVTINKQIATRVREFSNSKMINICQDTQAFINEYVISDLKALREKADEYLLAQAWAGAGVNYKFGGVPAAANTDTDVKVLGTSTDIGAVVPLYGNFVNVGLDFQSNKFNGISSLIGEGNLQKFYALSKYACCNSYGVAFDAAIAESGHAFYIDQAANSILGANKFLSIAQNVAHLLWFNENTNINLNSDLRKRITIQDPVYPGLKWDMDWEFTCDNKWTYKLSTWLDLFIAIQDDAFGDDEASPSPACETELLGVNGIFKYEATA